MISVKGLKKYFNRGGINEILALAGVELEVNRGDFISIIGSNGAGKSTLLNCISGTYPFSSGSLYINDEEVTLWPEYKRAKFIGRVFQDPLCGTCASLSIEQNMALALKRGMRRGLSKGVKSRYRNFLREETGKLKLGLEDRLHDQAGLLSGGQRQALTMLMATLIRPEVLLLDEHTAALDPKTAHQILDLTNEIVEDQNLTTLMVTHNMKQAIEMGNRLVMMHEGKIILDISGNEKKALKVDDLLARFYEIKGETFSSDRVLLS